MDLQQLKKELKQSSISKVIRKFILRDSAACFKGNTDLILELKESLSNYFDVHVKNIEIVGSAKLGMSLNLERFGQSYNEKSDIDLIIVSSGLFDKAWHELLKLEFKYYQLSLRDREHLKDCYETIPHGIISPDRLPLKSNFYKIWWKLFRELSGEEKYENRTIRARLFKNWWFVEKYYSIQLVKLSKA